MARFRFFIETTFGSFLFAALILGSLAITILG